MKKYAPKGSHRHDLFRSRPVPARARSRSRSSGTPPSPPTLTKPGLPVVNADGTPKWRMAPSPNGPYWKQGHAKQLPGRGLVDLLKDHDANRATACLAVCAVRDLQDRVAQKTVVGLTRSAVATSSSKAMTDLAPSSAAWSSSTAARRAWPGRLPAPTCPDYPKLAQLWWKNVAQAVTGEDPARRHGHAGRRDGSGDGTPGARGHGRCAQAQQEGRPKKWLSDKRAPWAKLANEKPRVKPSTTTPCSRPGRTAKCADLGAAAGVAQARPLPPDR